MLKAKKHIIFCLLTFVFYIKTNAQCAMCRAVLESEEGQKAAEGINDGIIYLMIIPYVLIGGLGFFVYKKLKQNKI